VQPCGVVAWWVPLGCPRCLSAPFLTKKFKNNFMEFFEKLYFQGFSKVDKRLKTWENEYGTMENKFKPSLQQL
jgi:hypothetical protein